MSALRITVVCMSMDCRKARDSFLSGRRSSRGSTSSVDLTAFGWADAAIRAKNHESLDVLQAPLNVAAVPHF
jgi:hypothetical protein